MRNLLFINTIVLLLLQITARIAIDSNNNNNNNNNKVFSAELSIVSNSNATAEYDYRQDMNYIASRYGGDILGVSNANILNVAEKKILMHIGIGANNKQMKVSRRFVAEMQLPGSVNETAGPLHLCCRE